MNNNDHQTLRKESFCAVSESFRGLLNYKSDKAILAGGDAVELLKRIPDNSISLILTDPPYHTTKKKNIKNDTAFASDDDFIAWLRLLAVEWKRVLRPNGSIYLFCSSKMSARIEVLFQEEFNVLSHVVWSKPNEPGFDGWKGKMKKESLRQWYAHSERIIFAEPAFDGNLHRSWFGHVLRETRNKCGLSGHQLTEIIGAYGKVNHGGAVSNWEAGRNVPSREQYQKMCKAFLDTGKVDSMPTYEDIIRPFEVNSKMEFTDVWDFYSVRPYKGKHPAEKPLNMLEHCINSSSYEGDIVLDCFAGSGSTAIACLENNRKSISIELDPKWIKAIANRLEKFESGEIDDNLLRHKQDIMKATKTYAKPVSSNGQPSLFG